MLKREKYAGISAIHYFVPVGIETSWVLGINAKQLLLDVGNLI